MDADSDFAAKTKEDILSSSKLKLTKEGDTGRSTLAANVFKGNVYLSVYPGTTNRDERSEKIQAPMDVFAFQYLLELIDLALASTTPNQWAVDFSNRLKSPDGERSKEITKVASVVVTRKDDGLITLSVYSADKNAPRIDFPFGFPNGQYMMARIKNAESPAIVYNHAAAKTWSKVMGLYVPLSARESYEAPPKNQNFGGRGGNFQRRPGGGGGGGGGYGNRGGGGGGGYQQRQGGYTPRNEPAGQGRVENKNTGQSMDAGDDIPF